MSLCYKKENCADIIEDLTTINMIDKLDYDCLVMIFRHLPVQQIIKMEKVCKHWRYASQLTWYEIKKLKLSNSTTGLDQKWEQENLKNIIAKCGIYLTHLNLSKVCRSNIMPMIVKYCYNLKKIELEFQAINVNDFYQKISRKKKNSEEYQNSVFTQFKKLCYFKMITNDRRSICYRNLEDTYNRILEGLPEGIEEIHFIQKKSVDVLEPAKTLVLDKFNTLRFLTLNYLPLDKKTMEIISQKKTLVYLDLKGCALESNTPSLLASLVNVEHLNLSKLHCETIITDNAFIEIIIKCTNIKHLNINGIKVSKNALNEIVKLKNIEHLDLGFVVQTSDILITKISNQCKNLQYLDVAWGNFFSKSALFELGNLERLEYLNFGAQWNIDDDVMFNITKKLRKLKYFQYKNLDYSSYSNSVFKGLAQLKNLEHLCFTHLNSPGGDLLNYVNQACPLLKHLDISHSVRILQSSLEKISELRNLEYLNLQSVHEVEDRVVTQIVNNCKKLKFLNISYCESVTDLGHTEFEKLENLEELHMSKLKKVNDNVLMKIHGVKKLDCNNSIVTDQGIAKILQNCPDLELLCIQDTKITHKSLALAAMKTKQRTDNLRLTLQASMPIIKKFKESHFHMSDPEKIQNESPLLDLFSVESAENCN